MTTEPTPAELDTEHANALTDVFCEIVRDCEQLGLRPCAVEVGADFTGGYAASVHFHSMQGVDVASVDALADAYGFGDDDGPPTVYTRRGRFTLNGRSVKVKVFTGRPTAVHDPARCVLPAAHLHSCLPAPAGRIAAEVWS